MNTINAQFNFFPGSIHILFYNRKKLSLEIFDTIEIRAKLSKTVDFKKPQLLARKSY